MSKLDALLTAIIVVLLVSVTVCVLSVLPLIGWIVLGVILVITIVVGIGIYQFYKHYIN